MAMARHVRPRLVGRRLGIPIVLVLAAMLAPSRGLEAGPAPDDKVGFSAQVAAHFEEWDLNRDGTLSSDELSALVPDVRIRDEAACALAAIHRVQRGKDPAWHHAAFRRDDLVGPDVGSGTGRRPPFARIYRQGLTRLRATRHELFGPAAPRLVGIHQGPLGDCFLIATVGAVVGRDPATVRALVGQSTDGTFLVRFPGGPTVPVASVSDTEILLGSTDGDQGLWLIVIEKAYGELVLACRSRPGTPMDLLSGAGTSTKTLQLFTGRDGLALRFRPHGSHHVPGRAAVAELAPQARAILAEAQLERRLICCGTTTAPAPPGITPNHIYAVLGYDASRDVVDLWNPWGHHFTPEGPAGLESGYPVRDGRFSVPMTDFVRIFAAVTYESRRPASHPWTRPR
jgi:hypothetical protein